MTIPCLGLQQSTCRTFPCANPRPCLFIIRSVQTVGFSVSPFPANVVAISQSEWCLAFSCLYGRPGQSTDELSLYLFHPCDFGEPLLRPGASPQARSPIGYLVGRTVRTPFTRWVSRWR